MEKKVNSYEFYAQWAGHPIYSLQRIRDHIITENPNKKFLYLADDSSLDNKAWCAAGPSKSAINGYEGILEPPTMVQDLTYHLNVQCQDSQYVAINCAVEESTLRDRKSDLLEQDKFIRDNIRKDDILLVSIGCNDIALSPSLTTIWKMLLLMGCNSQRYIADNPFKSWGMDHFITLFKTEIENYISRLTVKTKPNMVIVTAIYFPDMKVSGSWADMTLNLLGYNSNPEKLKTVIRQIYNCATCNISIPGVKIVPFPMFSVLDGTDSGDYVQRVEPSVQGGSKLAKAFVDLFKK